LASGVVQDKLKTGRINFVCPGVRNNWSGGAGCMQGCAPNCFAFGKKFQTRKMTFIEIGILSKKFTSLSLFSGINGVEI